jgi:hypothetical protein
VNEAQLSIETSLQQKADQIVATNGSHNAQLMVLLQQMQQKQDSATLTIQRLIERSKAPSIPPVVGRLSSLRILGILHSSQHVPPLNPASMSLPLVLAMVTHSYTCGNLQSVQLLLNEDKGRIMLKAFPSPIPHTPHLDLDMMNSNFGEEQLLSIK